MKTNLYVAPWTKPELTDEAKEAIKIISDDVWKEASIRYAAERDVKIRAGKSAPKGLQRFINEVLSEKFLANGWEGDSGYFYKNQTWIRITFRHQMSLGSDFIDAVKVCKKEGMKLAIIMAANHETLKLISPNDASAIISYEKLANEVMNLCGAIDIPLLIGELTPFTSASSDVNAELRKERPRDVTIPITKIRT